MKEHQLFTQSKYAAHFKLHIEHFENVPTKHMQSAPVVWQTANDNPFSKLAVVNIVNFEFVFSSNIYYIELKIYNMYNVYK